MGPPQSSFLHSSRFQAKAGSEMALNDIQRKSQLCCIKQLVPGEFYIHLPTYPLTSSRNGKRGKKWMYCRLGEAEGSFSRWCEMGRDLLLRRSSQETKLQKKVCSAVGVVIRSVFSLVAEALPFEGETQESWTALSTSVIIALVISQVSDTLD